MLKNTPDQYGCMAKALHWVIGLLVVVLLGVGLYMTDLENSPSKFQLYGMHKAFGAVVLGLMIFRLFWRVAVSPAPAPMPTHALWEQRLSRAVHYAFYVALIAMPLSGWAMSSAAGRPVSMFGLFSLPDLVAKNEELAEGMSEVHETLGNVIIVLIVLHVAGALKHHLIDKDGTLRRMLPSCCGRCVLGPKS